jgi:hypothetical protein
MLDVDIFLFKLFVEVGIGLCEVLGVLELEMELGGKICNGLFGLG